MNYLVEYIGRNRMFKDRIDADGAKIDRHNNLIFIADDNGDTEVAMYHHSRWTKWKVVEEQ